MISPVLWEETEVLRSFVIFPGEYSEQIFELSAATVWKPSC